MELEATLQVLCEGTYTRATRDRLVNGQWLEGDPAEIQNFKVFIVNQKGEQVEITKFISRHEEQLLYDQYLEQSMEDE